MAAKNTKISLFDRDRITDIFLGLYLNDEEKLAQDEKVLDLELKSDAKEENIQCLCCNYTFTDRFNQVTHYKSDWHRYNLKLSLIGGEMVSEAQFEDIIDDISSISGSDTESTDSSSSSDDDTRDSRMAKALENLSPVKPKTLNNPPSENSQIKRSPKIYFRNSANSLLSVYKCVLPYLVEEKDAIHHIHQLTQYKPKASQVCIILLSAGHFAAGVFEGGEPAVHKTYHRYVMRAKQGTVQSAKDSQNSASAPKSAGASLRRHNEAALGRDIQGLLTSWMDEHIGQCSHIFLRVPHHQKGVFYDGKSAPFTKKDARIRGIPFPTRRPTFNELKRVWKELYSVEIHDAEPEKKAKKDYHKQAIDAETPNKPTEQRISSQMGEDNSVAVAASPRRKKKQKKKEQSEEQSRMTSERNEVDDSNVTTTEAEENASTHIVDELYTVCKIGDLEGLKAIVASLAQCSTEAPLLSHEDQVIPLYLNQTIGPNEESILHIAAKAGHKDVVYHLMEIGADPSVRNKESNVPYSVSSDKAMRNTFRKFMADHPEKYDYKSAQIPAPLTEEMEKKQKQKTNQKKKAQQAAKKRKQKEAKAEKAKTEKENEEKERFAALSDREKRAIAAERRMAQQMVMNGMQSPTNAKRCWMCGELLLGKIPFEYLDFQFCAMGCLKKHKALETVSK